MLARVIALLAFVVAAFAKLEVLDSATFDTAVANDVWFVKFYAPWCGHCNRLAPTWDKLAEEVESNGLAADSKVHIAKVDCTKDGDVCTKNGVRGYPTLLLFKNGETGKKHQGGRDLNTLVDFVKSNL